MPSADRRARTARGCGPRGYAACAASTFRTRTRLYTAAAKVNSTSCTRSVSWGPCRPRPIRVAAERLGVRIQLLEAREPGDFEGAFQAATRERADVLWVSGDPITYKYRAQIADRALKRRVPTHFVRESVEAGGLIAFRPSLPHLTRGVGKYVDKILKGAKPADIPVEQPTRYDLAINLKTAKTLGLTIPQPLLLRADQVIE
jgi:ABC-type uncharacterized transport system substrate-binding protein